MCTDPYLYVGGHLYIFVKFLHAWRHDHEHIVSCVAYCVRMSQDSPGSNVMIDVAPDVLKAIAEAEAQRAKNSESGESESGEVDKKIGDSIARLVEQARKLREGEENGEKSSSAGEAAMRREFESLLTSLTSPRGVDPEDIKLLKESVFGPQTFWVTEQLMAAGFERGVAFKGNFRGPQEAIFEKICKQIDDLFEGKYVVRLAEQTDQLDSASLSEEITPFIVIQVIPKDVALPKPTATWQRGAAVVLLALTLGSSLQLGLAANVGLLPKETLAWLSNPANLNASDPTILPPGLENYDPLPFLQSAVTVSGLALLPQFAHEIGHIVTAAVKGLKIGTSFLIPNGQLGTFGSITQLKSLAKNRKELFDFAASGLVSGGVVSLALFIAGLMASQASGNVGDVANNSSSLPLIPVPVSLFQGSLLLGGITKLALGSDAIARTNVMVSPLLIGGWCGLVSFALNSLPVGNLDGGRAMLASYGRTVLAFTSLLSYLGLGLGLLGSSLSLPFGLYVLICQRESEKNIQDEISEVDERRKSIAIALAFLAVLILIPGIPDATEMALLEGSSNFL